MAVTDVENLTNSELREKLLEFGCPVGPVTLTTRKPLIKKLKKLLESGANDSFNAESSHASLQSSFEDTDAPRTRSRTPVRNRSPGRPANRSPGRSSVISPKSSYSDVGIDISSAITNGSKRPTRSLIHPDSDVSKNSGTSFLSNYESPTYVPEVSSTFTSYGNNDTLPPSNTSRHLNSSLDGLKLSDTFRSRFSDANDADYNLSTVHSISSAHPLNTDLTKRLSTGRTTQRTDFRTSIGGMTSKLMDVKESDDEDSGPAPVYAKFTQSGSRGVSLMTNIKNNRRISASEGWLPFDYQISTILLLIFLLFFVIIGVTYVNMHSTDASLSSPSEITLPICLSMPSHVPGENCIRDIDKDTVLRLFNIVYKVHYDSAMNGPCRGNKEEPITFTDENIINMIVEHDKTMSVWVVEQHLKNLKVLIDANPKWKIKPSRQGITIHESPVSYYCYILNNVYLAVDWFFRISIACGTFYAIYLAIRWWIVRQARYKEDVYKLVSSIIEIVSSKAHTQDSFIPISHVRDQLIAPKDRDRMNKLWEDALTLLESDSRLRTEVQQMEGEEFLVWRWLASSANNISKRKVWQGQAFDTMEGSVNSLQHSPTSYLKIRHMFDANLEEGDEWIKTVVDAILEKCGKAKVLHLVVDTQSREGCVYMKCASTYDAGLAYRALHGSWFDSNLVTVKYIREKRYLERFPESANCVNPLRPTSDRN